MEAGTITITGHEGDEIEAYLARPTGRAAFGGMVVIHHLPGYDARTNAAASSGLAPGACREYRFGQSAAYPSAANRRTISFVPAS